MSCCPGKLWFWGSGAARAEGRKAGLRPRLGPLHPGAARWARPPASAPTLSATKAERRPRTRRPLLPPRGGARLCSRACRTRRAPVRSLATGPAPSPAPARSLATNPQSAALTPATVYGLQSSESPGRASLQERGKGLPQLFPEKVFSSLLREKGLRGGVGEGNRVCRRQQSRRGVSLEEPRREHAGSALLQPSGHCQNLVSPGRKLPAEAQEEARPGGPLRGPASLGQAWLALTGSFLCATLSQMWAHFIPGSHEVGDTHPTSQAGNRPIRVKGTANLPRVDAMAIPTLQIDSDASGGLLKAT